MDKSEREIYYEYRAIKEKEICQACPKCLSTILECSKKGRSEKEYILDDISYLNIDTNTLSFFRTFKNRT